MMDRVRVLIWMRVLGIREGYVCGCISVENWVKGQLVSLLNHESMISATKIMSHIPSTELGEREKLHLHGFPTTHLPIYQLFNRD